MQLYDMCKSELIIDMHSLELCYKVEKQQLLEWSISATDYFSI